MSDLFFGILGLACGAYCLHAGYMMRKTGVICTTILLDKETAKKKCNDTGLYLVEVIPPTITLGGVTFLYGVVSLVESYLIDQWWMLGVILVVDIIVLVWFAIVTSKAKKKYFN